VPKSVGEGLWRQREIDCSWSDGDECPQLQPVDAHGECQDQYGESEYRQYPVHDASEENDLAQFNAAFFKMIAKKRHRQNDIENQLHCDADKEHVLRGLQQDEECYNERARHPAVYKTGPLFLKHPHRRLSLQLAADSYQQNSEYCKRNVN